MRKKLTIEYIRSEFEKEGYTLLSEEYVNAKTKLNYRCAKGHEYSATWHSWQKGSRCSYCAGVAKLTIDQIRVSFELEGYVLLTKEYINCKTKLDYRCSEGHIHSINWSNWQQGRRCPYCCGNIKYTIDQVRELFNKEGYYLLSKEYIDSNHKLIFICNNNHSHSIAFHSWLQGCRCTYCSDKTKLTYKFINEEFNKEGYTLISKDYTNSNTKLDYTCSKGHGHSMEWRSWQRGNRCPTCANINRSIISSGSGNNQWQGGVSYEPYCEVWKDKEYKQDIRERDGNKCLNPRCYSKNSHKLTIHHIDYDKKNCRPSNLITVCRGCNAAANIDRDWHTTWYQAIIKNRYGGVKKCLYQ